MFYELAKYLFFRPLAYVLFWPSIVGRNKVPAHGPAILAVNHLGTGEAFLLPTILKPRLVFPAKKELFRTDTVLRWLAALFLRLIGQIPMDRDGGDASAGGLGSMHQVLRDGGTIAIFPEGHRSPDGRLYRGHTGVARLALTEDVVIYPIGAFNTRFTKKKWLPFPWLYRPRLIVGDPRRLPEDLRQRYLMAPDREAAGEALRQATDLVMSWIQDITGQEQVDEYSWRPKKSRRRGEPVG